MLEVLRTDYIKFARARGLSNRADQFRPCAEEHAGAGDHHRRACSSARSSPSRIVTETVFQWPGMGLLFIQSVQFADIPVMAAYLMLIALVFVVINLVVDLLYFARRSAPARSAAARRRCDEQASGRATSRRLAPRRRQRPLVELHVARRSTVARRGR